MFQEHVMCDTRQKYKIILFLDYRVFPFTVTVSLSINKLE